MLGFQDSPPRCIKAFPPCPLLAPGGITGIAEQQVVDLGTRKHSKRQVLQRSFMAADYNPGMRVQKGPDQRGAASSNADEHNIGMNSLKLLLVFKSRRIGLQVVRDER